MTLKNINERTLFGSDYFSGSEDSYTRAKEIDYELVNGLYQKIAKLNRREMEILIKKIQGGNTAPDRKATTPLKAELGDYDAKYKQIFDDLTKIVATVLKKDGVDISAIDVKTNEGGYDEEESTITKSLDFNVKGVKKRNDEPHASISVDFYLNKKTNSVAYIAYDSNGNPRKFDKPDGAGVYVAHVLGDIKQGKRNSRYD